MTPSLTVNENLHFLLSVSVLGALLVANKIVEIDNCLG